MYPTDKGAGEEARKKIELVRKRLEDKGFSYYVTFPDGSDEAEREFLKQTDALFSENPPN